MSVQNLKLHILAQIISIVEEMTDSIRGEGYFILELNNVVFD